MAWELTIRHDHRLAHPAERIWDAVATGRGNRGWLYPIEIEPWVGGAVARGVGGTVEDWSPPHRLAMRIADGTGFASALGYDVDDDGHLHVTIHWRHEDQDEPDADWKAKADAAEAYAVFYHRGLREYLDHFADADATYLKALAEPGAPRTPFPARLATVGVAPDAVAGDTVRYTPPDDAPREAVLVHRDDDFALLRTAEGLHRFFNGERWDGLTWTAHHLFAPDVDEAARTRAWQEWLAHE